MAGLEMSQGPAIATTWWSMLHLGPEAAQPYGCCRGRAGMQRGAPGWAVAGGAQPFLITPESITSDLLLINEVGQV